jgi:hypothetical protein
MEKDLAFSGLINEFNIDFSIFIMASKARFASEPCGGDLMIVFCNHWLWLTKHIRDILRERND